jgi:ATP-binding cassette subfamily C protein
MEAVECGAAALAIMLRYYGRSVPLAELRRECGVSRDGSKASNVLQAARRYGLIAKGFRKELQSVQALRPPYIVFWDFNHFLVVEGFRKQRVWLNDPASGRRTASLDEFDQAFTGVVLVLEPGPTFTRGGRESSTMHALRTRLRGSGAVLVYCFLTGFFLMFPRLAVPVFTRIFIDHVLVQQMQDWLRPLLLGMLLTSTVYGLLRRIQLLHLRRLKLKLATVMSSQFLWHMLHLPASFYAQRYAGEMSHRMPLNDKVADVLSGRLATASIDAMMMIVYVAVMWQYDVVLTLLGASCATGNFVALHWLSRRRVDTNLRCLQEFGKAGGHCIAGLQNIETLKASAMESAFFARWAGYYTKAMHAQQELDMASQTLSVLSTLLSTLTSVLVLVVGGWRVMQGHLSIGMLVALQSLMHSFLAPVTTLVNLGSTLQELQGDLHRLDDVLHNPLDPELSQEPAQAVMTAETSRLQGAVELRHVTFGYSRIDPPLVENLCVTLQPGDRVALVGASGSGKSTIAKLVCGLYAAWEGDVLLDGVPRVQIPRQVVGQSLAMVDQDVMLFAGTVRDNLTLWDATVPDSALVQACKDAAIHEAVVAMAGGYDAALLEGGANLSGGQRQRLEIARALVANPAILVLDEATSALDAETEHRIVQNIRRRGCTCLIVAHRLSTIRDCDEIIVLEQGRVVQRGTHRALMQAGGVYAHLIHDEGEALVEAW